MEGLCQVRGLEGMLGPVGGGPESGHDLEREVPGRDERFGGRLGGQHLARRDPPRPGVGDSVDDQ
jgi:hypothetical protein